MADTLGRLPMLKMVSLGGIGGRRGLPEVEGVQIALVRGADAEIDYHVSVPCWDAQRDEIQWNRADCLPAVRRVFTGRSDATRAMASLQQKACQSFQMYNMLFLHNKMRFFDRAFFLCVFIKLTCQ